LSAAEPLLEEAGETFWSEKISKALRTYRSDDVALSRTVRSWTDSMGSFSDLMIHPFNDHDVRLEGARQKHVQFDGLRTAAYHYLSPRH
jgi:hypothetical protein